MAHTHNIIDSDKRFSIDPITRAITNASGKVNLVQHDHNSERFTFDIPRHDRVEGHDMSLCSKVEIHYINVSGSKNEQSADVYLVEDLAVDEWDEDKVVFSWLISANATKYAGTLNFLIRFVCLDGSKVEYSWNTAIFSGITVDNGMNNGEAVVAEYADVLEAWRQEVLYGADGALSEIEAAHSQALTDIAEAKATMLEEIEVAGEIVQTTGNSHTAVMSQKATTEVNNRANKRVDNIETGVAYSITDSTVAYVKDVPENALPYAELQKLGGMSRKCTNLIPFPYYYGDITLSGIRFTINTDGSITATGTATDNACFYVFVGIDFGSTPAFSEVVPQSVNGYTFSDLDYDGEGNGYLYYPTGRTVNHTYYPMINKGATALPYEPYFEGLRSAPVSSVESVGANLISFPYNIGGTGTVIESNGGRIEILLDGGLSLSGTPTSYVGARVYAGSLLFKGEQTLSLQGTYTNYYVTVFLYDSPSMENLVVQIPVNGEKTFNTDDYPTATYMIVDSGRTSSNVPMSGTVYPMLNKGTTALPYAPYTKSTLSIPEAVQALDGYGEGNPDDPTEYNSIQWDKKGNCSYSHKGNIVNNEWVPLSNEIVTDISALITADNLITVYDKGTIKFVNEHGYDVPNIVEWKRDKVKMAVEDGVVHDYIPEFTSGCIRNCLDGAGVGSTAQMTTYESSYHHHIIVPCAEGESFRLHGFCYHETERRLYSFLDKNNVVLDCSPLDIELNTELNLVAPKGSVKLACNFVLDADSVLQKLAEWTITKKKVEKMEEATEDIGEIVDYIPNFVSGCIRNCLDGAGVGSTALMTTYSSSAHSYIVVESTEGDTFKLYGTCANETERRLYSFLDKNNVVLQMSYNKDLNKELTLVAPKNTAKLACNFILDDNSVLQKVTGLHRDVLVLDNNMNEVSTGIIYDYKNDFVLNKYIMNCLEGGYVGSVAPLTTYESTHSYVIVPCAVGDRFCFKGSCYAETSRRLYSFLDENNVVLSCSGSAEAEIDGIIVAPENTAKLVCNSYMTDDTTLQKVTEMYCDLYNAEKKAEEAKTVAENISQKSGTYDTTEEKYIFPKWAEVHPFKEKDLGYVYSTDYYKYNYFYGLFENLYQTYKDSVGLEKIDVGVLYNNASGETTPSYISAIENGGIYMYHIPPRTVSGSTSGTEFRHKKLKLLLVSGLHGSEKRSIFNNYVLLKEMLEGSTDRAIINLRNFVDIYMVPMVNVSGIETGDRGNANGADLNRDYPVNAWTAYDSNLTAPNSQWETRVIGHLLDYLSPDAVVDHHTSTGDATSETIGKTIQWGSSSIPSIVSLIEENIVETTPYLVAQFPEKLGHYNHIFGFGSGNNQNVGYLEVYAHEKGCITSIIETILALKWDAAEGWIFGHDDEAKKDLTGICYFTYINYLMKFVDEAVRYKNEKIAY